jgi:hypothetical protein
MPPSAILWILRVVVVLCVALAWSESVQRFLGLTPGTAMLALGILFGSWLLVGGLRVTLRAMRHPVDEISRGLKSRGDRGRNDSKPSC